MHSRPCASHHSRYTLRTFERIPVMGNLRNPCFCAAANRIRSFCVSRWPVLRLPIFARVGMPRLSRSTSSLLGLGIVQIVTACAGSMAICNDKPAAPKVQAPPAAAKVEPATTAKFEGAVKAAKGDASATVPTVRCPRQKKQSPRSSSLNLESQIPYLLT